jgi:EmrB/QacA subfamily drug resistance transporter
MSFEPIKKRILMLLALAMFLVVLDSAIVNLALPAIKSAMHFSSSSLQWVLTAYILTFGGFLMLGGRLADLYGRRRILVIGMAGFSMFSLLIGLSVSGPMLITLRGLQGISAALMAPTALSILLATFAEGEERNKALSVWSVVAAGGAAIGVFLGGLLTQYLGWRWCFFVNVPIALLGVVGVRKFVPAHMQEGRDKHLDLPGAVLVTGGLMTLVYALTQAAQAGWTAASTLTTLAVSVIMIVAFLFNEMKAKHPLVPLSIFRIRNVSGASLVMLPVMAGALGMFYFSSLFIQNVLHYSSLQSGVAFLPVPIIIGILSYRAPKLLGRFGPKPLMVIGISLTTLGTFLMSFVSAQSSYATLLLPAFLILALGFGVAFVSVAVAATAGVPGNKAGLASGLINTSQQIGGALGLAILAVVASSVTKESLTAGKTLADASVAGYQRAFLYAAVLMAIALLVAIFVIHTPKKQAGKALEPAVTN